MKQRLIYFLICLTTLSCVVYEYEDQRYSQEVNKTKEELAEETITEYLKERVGEKGNVYHYFYGPLYQLTPPELKELEELKEHRKKLPEMRENYPNNLDSLITATDTLIKEKERYIKANNIHRRYEMNHLFCLEDSNERITFYDMDFTMNYKAEIIDVHSNATMKVSKDDFKYLDFLLTGDFFIDGNNDAVVIRENRGFYDYFYPIIEASSDKAIALEQTVRVMKESKKQAAFDTVHLVKWSVKEYLNDLLKENSYKPKNFSTIVVTNPIQKERRSLLKQIDSLKKEDGNEELINELSLNIEALPGSDFPEYKVQHAFRYEEENDSVVTTNYLFLLDSFFRVLETTKVPIEKDEK